MRRTSLVLQTVLPFISHKLIHSSRYSSAICSDNLGQYGQLYRSIRHCNSYQQQPLRNVIWQMNYKLLHECKSSNDTLTCYWLTTGIRYPQTAIFPFTAFFTPFTVVFKFSHSKGVRSVKLFARLHPFQVLRMYTPLILIFMTPKEQKTYRLTDISEHMDH